MKYVALICACGLLVTFWWAPLARAQDPALQVVQQNLAIAYQPPQASAEALLSLPSVYVLPGSFLYWCKQVIEQVRLILASSPQQRSALLLDFSQQRLAEGYQAMQQQNWPAAKRALQDYQHNQDEIAKSLSSLQKDHQHIDDLLDQLRNQLGIQQALGQYVSQNPKPEAKEISALLQVRSRQTLALAVAENGALLGAKDTRQATASAQSSPSATVSATPTMSISGP